MLAVSITVFLNFGTTIAILCSVITFLAVIGVQSLKNTYRILRRDLTGGHRFSRVQYGIHRFIGNDTTLPEAFKATVARFPNKVMFRNKQRDWTFKEAEDFSNQVANCFQSEGFASGDTVALVMENCPEYVLLWLGLSKIGVVSALINSNLKSLPLAHSMKIVNAKAVIFTPVLANNIVVSTKEICEQVGSPSYYCFGECTEADVVGAKTLSVLIQKATKTPPSFRGSIRDRLMYIYTSGTTGLPKAVIIRHMRYLTFGCATFHMMPLKSADILYLYLPFYHMAGVGLGCSQVLLYGLTGFVAPKFSASRFWLDCIEYNCTVTQYIGEICRYLLNQPQSPGERQHSIRLMYGNGLRKQLWEEFQCRFGIKDLRELYGSTEGNSNLLNIDNTPGAVGFLPAISWIAPPIANKILPLRIIKVDESTGVPIRDAKGLCMPCKFEETGELVAAIKPQDPMRSFDGYVDNEATKKKIYTDVFSKGDTVFSSGDLLYQDKLGYLYFRDRTGDTFRWKGENVSTCEVEEVMSKIVGLKGCVVYGVEIVGTEGRAGMAAIAAPEGSLDLASILNGLRSSLPSYAIPIFIRQTQSLETTDTYKVRKVNFVNEGFDVSIVSDPIYFLDISVNEYVPLSNELYMRIQECSVRL